MKKSGTKLIGEDTAASRRNLALIPARGGSKSIPQKNIVDLEGKPLIAHVIEAVKKSSAVNRIIVSTDDMEIVNVAKEFGVEVPFMRPKELAQDNTPTIPVVEHAIWWLENNENYKPDYILLVQPTEPFVTSEQIDELLRLVIEKNADSGITMIPVPRNFHPYHVRKLNQKGYLEFDNPETHYKHPNRQSDPKRYAFGNCYWFERSAFLKERKIEVGKRVGLEIDPIYAHDINTSLDLEIARVLAKKLKNEKA